MINEKKYVSMLKLHEKIGIVKRGLYIYIITEYTILRINIKYIKVTLSKFIFILLGDNFDITHDFDIEYSKKLNKCYIGDNSKHIDMIIDFHSQEREILEDTSLLVENSEEILNIFVKGNKEYFFIPKKYLDIVHRKSNISIFKKLIRFDYQDISFYTVKKSNFSINKKFLKILEG